jgi:AGZA family xanthine/uracil permease-like MFS transporter
LPAHLLPYCLSSSRWGCSTSRLAQNIESAEAAGDPRNASIADDQRPRQHRRGALAPPFRRRSTSAIRIGARRTRRLFGLNGAFITIICLTGTLAWIAGRPIDAGMAIVLWIGIVISAQAFQATPRETPAVVIGLLPGIGAWAALMAKNG